MFELSQRFYFEAAHTLHREIDAESSRRIHGHTYHAEVAVRGIPDPKTGMLVDLGKLRASIEALRAQLDHQFLDELDGLGAPTLENLCAYIGKVLRVAEPALHRVTVSRQASGDSCSMTLDR